MSFITDEFFQQIFDGWMVAVCYRPGSRYDIYVRQWDDLGNVTILLNIKDERYIFVEYEGRDYRPDSRGRYLDFNQRPRPPVRVKGVSVDDIIDDMMAAAEAAVEGPLASLIGKKDIDTTTLNMLIARISLMEAKLSDRISRLERHSSTELDQS